MLVLGFGKWRNFITGEKLLLVELEPKFLQISRPFSNVYCHVACYIYVTVKIRLSFLTYQLKWKIIKRMIIETL